MLKTNRTTYRTLHVGPLTALCLLMLTACSSDTVQPDNGTDQQGKTPIELTVGIVGEGSAATRTVVTNDDLYGQKAKAFEAGTSLYMVMKSQKNGGADTDVKYSRTIGYAQEKVDDINTSVKFAANYVRYWEDSYSRDSKLSVYAVCVPGYYLLASRILSSTEGTGTEDNKGLSINNSNVYTYTGSTTTAWTDASPATIVWPLREATVANQTADFINNQDLCFSNNVTNLAFNTTNKKFGSDRMIFYHALTKITFKISKGDGFGETDAFAFSNANENIVLKGFNTGGTFSIVDGEFKTSNPAISTETINQMAEMTAKTGVDHVLSALLVPGTDLSDATVADAIHFTLQGNKYSLTKAALTEAKIVGSSTTVLKGAKLSDNTTAALIEEGNKLLMRPGVHYIFTLTVGKTGISNLTAAVVPWEEVTAEASPSNARIKLSLFDNGTHKSGTADFDLYRSAQQSDGDAVNDDFAGYAWERGYTGNKATLEKTSTSGVYTAKTGEVTWLWPDSKTFYHFRAVMPVNHEVKTDNNNTTDTTDDDKEYITLTGEAITSSNVNSENKYIGVCWGAPFLSTTGKLTYSLQTGFDNKQNLGANNESHQIYKAIGATKDVIHLTLFHMMSDVTIKIATTEGTDKVTLIDETDPNNKVYTNISLSSISSTGTVLMGNGLVTPTNTTTELNATINSNNEWRYAFVPQDLASVVLTITTPDKNQYKVNMKDVEISLDAENNNQITSNVIANPYEKNASGKYVIDRWYPNFKYTYTFTLKKTGITVSATLADWETVTAGKDDVQIE